MQSIDRKVAKFVLAIALLPLLGIVVEGTEPTQSDQGSFFKPMITDRPSQSDSSSVLSLGLFQFELGWTRTLNDDSGVRTETVGIPETLIRYGFSEKMELRFGFAGLRIVDTEVGAQHFNSAGGGDSSLGVKFALMEESDMLPEVAFIGTLSLPTGANKSSSRRMDPSLRVACSHTLNEKISLGYNLGLAWNSEEGDSGRRHTTSAMEWTTVLGFAVNEKLGIYSELYGDVGLSRPGGPANSFNTGLTYLVQPNLQLDSSIGFGLSEDADDWFVGVGVSFRYPN